MMLDRLLSGPRAIARDLIDKHLLPVALLLLVALVAVPVVLGRSGDEAPVTPAVVPAPPAQPGADTAIKVSAAPVLGRARPGAIDDPFYNPPKEADASSGAATTATSSSSAATPAPSGDSSTGTGSGGTGGTEAPSPPAQTPQAPASSTSYTFYRPRVRFGTDENAAVRGLSRQQPLGDPANPAALYLGPTADHQRAAFLLGPNAIVTGGEGACGEKTCRVVALRPGQSITMGVVGPSGYAEHSYVLKVEEIHEQKVGSEDSLMTLRDRVDADGRDVLREMIKDRPTATAVGKLTYDRGLGAVVLVDSV